MDPIAKKRLIIAIVLFVLLSLLFIIIAVVQNGSSSTKNQFGEYIKIQNYNDKVKGVPSDIRDAIQTSLYRIVKKNSSSNFNPLTVKDAYIRDSSESLKYDESQSSNYGTFIVDMGSIRQSYGIQYSYSPKGVPTADGTSVVLSCLGKDKLKYGDFKCVNILSDEINEIDSILQYLPYQNFTFKIVPRAADDGALTLVVTLTIPESDLKGDAASRASTVTMYKAEVEKWVSSKGLDPAKYKYLYNYTDNGDLIN